MSGEKQQAFAHIKSECLPTQCIECKWLFACHGECPKNRIVSPISNSIEIEKRGFVPRINFLCKGYQQFFQHAAPYMDFMKQQLLNNNPPSLIMQYLSEKER